MRALNRIKIEIKDFIRFNDLAKYIAAYMLYLWYRRKANCTQFEMAKSINKLCQAARIAPNIKFRINIEKNILKKLETLSVKDFPWDEIYPDSRKNIVEKGIILKLPKSNNEKGVLLISFENQWLRLFRHGNLQNLEKFYDLVLAPSWSPSQDLPLFLASKLWPGKFYHLLSNCDDIEIFRRLYPNSIHVPLLASNWVNPEIFKPNMYVEKEFDIIVLTNFAKYKRHFSIFRLLHKMPKSIRVLILGKSWEGRTAETLMKEAALWNVSDQVLIREGLSDKEMIEEIQKSKIGFIPSLNEGSCVAVTELLFLNVPVALYGNAIIGSKRYINDHTGVLLQQNDWKGLLSFIQNWKKYSPRKFMLQEKACCYGSTEVLNKIIKYYSTLNDTPWTTDIVPHHWRPNPNYVSSGIADFENEYHNFKYKYSLSIVNHTP